MKDLSLHLIDLTQNALEAGSNRVIITVEQSRHQGYFKFTISDDGKGMDAALLQEVTDPFTTTRKTRRVGMGLPLMKQNAERTGGYLTINSKVGTGTTVEVMIHHQHIDAPPLGAWAESVAMLLGADEQVSVAYHHITDQGKYTISTDILQETLGDIPLGNPQITTFVREMIEENLDAIDVFEGLI